MNHTKHRLSLLQTQSQIIQESKATILMSKVKQLYEKLATQISQNQSLSQQNQKLKLKLSELQSKQLQSSTSDSTLTNNSPLFNLFIEKINNLENENKRLREEKERNNSNLSQLYFEGMVQNQNVGNGNMTKRNSSINEKYVSPHCSTSCFSNDENINVATLGVPNSGCFSPRYGVNGVGNLSKRMSLKENENKVMEMGIDRLWLSPNRKNLQKLIGGSKNR